MNTLALMALTGALGVAVHSAGADDSSAATAAAIRPADIVFQKDPRGKRVSRRRFVNPGRRGPAIRRGSTDARHDVNLSGDGWARLRHRLECAHRNRQSGPKQDFVVSTRGLLLDAASAYMKLV